MTRLEIRRRVLQALNDAAIAPVFWSVDEINETIAEAQEALAEEALSLKRTFMVPRRAGVMIYNLDGIGANIMAPTRIWLPDLHRRLGVWSLTDLDARHERWQAVTGDPWVWWPIDWRSFGLWPVPATAGGILEVDCYVWPDVLPDDSARPEFPPADHEALVTYGEIEGYIKQGDVLRALDLAKVWGQRWADGRYRAGIEQIAASFVIRERSHGGGQT